MRDADEVLQIFREAGALLAQRALEHRADIVAVACIEDRSTGKTDVGMPLVSPSEYEAPVCSIGELAPAMAAIPPIKPGSCNQ